MDLTPRETDLLDAYLQPYVALSGDRRTAQLVAGVVQGMSGSESLICARIAAFSPSAGHQPSR